METRVLKVDARRPDEAAVSEAARIIRDGGLVAFPTETVYGLGANALDAAAVARIFAAKGRPADNPLIVHIADPNQLSDLVEAVPPPAQQLMERFWPGPLTLILPRTAAVPPVVTAGLGTVAVRRPDHPVALALIRAAGVPIAAPSANRSGRPSSTVAAHVHEDLAGQVDLILDAGPTGLGLESTVLDLSTDPPVVLRPGGVTAADICAVIGPVEVGSTRETDEDDVPRSPGTKYIHYAPKALLIVVDGPFLESVQAKINDLAYEFTAEGRRVGILATAETRGAYQAPVVLEVGSRKNMSMVAAGLFSALRAFDQYRVDVVLSEGFPEDGIGYAVMDRLRRAAGGRVVQV